MSPRTPDELRASGRTSEQTACRRGEVARRRLLTNLTTAILSLFKKKEVLSITHTRTRARAHAHTHW